jgi:hypothetical protein
MLIQCLLKRPGGTHITMADGTAYHFAPNERDDHVAEVPNQVHFARLLSITEAYRVYNLSLGQPKAPPAPPATPGKADAGTGTGSPGTMLAIVAGQQVDLLAKNRTELFELAKLLNITAPHNTGEARLRDLIVAAAAGLKPPADPADPQ